MKGLHFLLNKIMTTIKFEGGIIVCHLGSVPVNESLCFRQKRIPGLLRMTFL